MLVAPKYSKIDVPVFNPDTDVVDMRYDPDPIENYETTFVRGLRLGIDPRAQELFSDLGECLESTDEELQRAANACGAEVVPHSWGLLKLPDNPSGRLTELASYSHNIVPDGYIVVAEVELIKEMSAMLSISDKITVFEGIKQYKESKKPGELILSDTHTHQYASGVTPSSGGKRVLWLFDIEPVIELI